MCFPHTIHFFNRNILSLRQEEEDGGRHDDNESGEEEEEAELHDTQHMKETLCDNEGE